MRVFISIDMEGVAGVASRRQVTPDASDYALGRRLMTAEANAAIAGAFDAGARTVLVNDSHGPMDNLLGEELDPRAEYVVGSPKRLSMVEQIDGGWDVMLLVGYHAGPQDGEAVLAHCYSGAAFTDVRLNGVSMSEADLNAIVAAHFGVPIGLVTGDQQTCDHAVASFPDVVTVPVKTGLGVTAARSLTPVAARERITEGARRAVQGAHSMGTISVPDTLELEVDCRPPGAAEFVMLVPGSARQGARTVRRDITDPLELLQVLTAWAHLAVAGMR